MTVSRVVRGLLVLASSAILFGLTSASAAQETTGTDGVVAEVGGKKLTLSELEHSMADRLFQARQQYYVAQKAALEQWIDDQVLEAEAKRQNITVKELLDRNVKAKVTDPTDDQLRVYYEGVNTDQPFEAVREKVLQHIRDARTAKIGAAYVKTLREQAAVLITLGAPSNPSSVKAAAASHCRRNTTRNNMRMK